jgi:hypothetical protein
VCVYISNLEKCHDFFCFHVLDYYRMNMYALNLELCLRDNTHILSYGGVNKIVKKKNAWKF